MSHCPNKEISLSTINTLSKVKEINEAYIVKDDIEIGSNGVIPLWLFGFLY